MKDFNMPYFYLHPTSGRSWLTDDPYRWLLDHRDDDLLAPARERLLLSADDPERCIRAALRRCGLALVRLINESMIAVRHWSEPVPDLRTWAKEFGWNRSDIGVSFESLKAGKVVVRQDTEDLLAFGERVGPDFPWPEYTARYERRHTDEPDDGEPAPVSFTNFTWEGTPPERLTWRVLKAIWTAEQVACPNCDVPLVLISFDWQKGMMSFRSARIVRHCLRCRRRFEDSEDRPLEWLVSVLPAPLRPTNLRLWAAIPIDWPRPALAQLLPTCADR